MHFVCKTPSGLRVAGWSWFLGYRFFISGPSSGGLSRTCPERQQAWKPGRNFLLQRSMQPPSPACSSLLGITDLSHSYENLTDLLGKDLAPRTFPRVCDDRAICQRLDFWAVRSGLRCFSGLWFQGTSSPGCGGWVGVVLPSWGRMDELFFPKSLPALSFVIGNSLVQWDQTSLIYSANIKEPPNTVLGMGAPRWVW